MKDRICIVTGANGAIGQAVAVGLARLGATIVLACRNQERGESARSAVMAAVGKATVELMIVDLSSQHSIREAVADFILKHNRLDVLINVAAVFMPNRTLTADGLETMFATNHLAPFLMTNLLLDTLRASTAARILTVTAPSTTSVNFDDLQGEKHYSALQAFGASKMCNLLYTYELARQLEGTGVTANAIHPGIVRSDLMKGASPIIRLFSRLLPAVSAEKAAETPVYLASDPEIASATGKFFKDKRLIDSNAYSHDQTVQHRLWEISAMLVSK